jgi:ubiquinone/menaquinone biosynthesis C-methylase UbiE
MVNLKRVVDHTLLHALGSKWIAYRERRAWNRHARRDPLGSTAAHDASNWEAYWQSGQRDFAMIMDLAREGDLAATDCAVEIGCGLGRLTRVAAASFRHVIALDISREMLRRAEQEGPGSNISYEQIYADFRLPIPDRTADMVFAWTVFRHVPKAVFTEYLSEIRRILKPDGCLVFEAQIRESGEIEEPAATETYTEREYTRRELASRCAESGFKWASERVITSVTPGTHNLIVAWRKGRASGSAPT